MVFSPLSTVVFCLLAYFQVESFLFVAPATIHTFRNMSFERKSSVQSVTEILQDKLLIDQILGVAVDSSKKAGAIIRSNVIGGGSDVIKRKANNRDLLTQIDPLCESIIRETVLSTFPLHNFLGEEDVPPGKEASAAALDEKLQLDGFLWCVDPIDGTTNFVNGMPLCMPSVAVIYQGVVIVGVIYDCHREELFAAIKGRGAYMNGEKISVGKAESMSDAIVAMGSPPGQESMEMTLKGIQVFMPKVRTIRMLGSAALMLAWVANGRLTCYWEYDLSSWDIAAGALLVQEAGGRFTDFQGTTFELQKRKICASNGLVHDEVLRVLREDAGIV